MVGFAALDAVGAGSKVAAPLPCASFFIVDIDFGAVSNSQCDVCEVGAQGNGFYVLAVGFGERYNALACVVALGDYAVGIAAKYQLLGQRAFGVYVAEFLFAIILGKVGVHNCGFAVGRRDLEHKELH